MFSNIVVDHLDDNIDTLRKTINLFCEQGVGDQCIVVKTTFDDEHMYVPVKSANLQILINRYGVYQGHAYYNSIHSLIMNMVGIYSYTNEEDEVETYNIKSVIFNGFTPFKANEDERLSFSLNYTINYIVV